MGLGRSLASKEPQRAEAEAGPWAHGRPWSGWWMESSGGRGMAWSCGRWMAARREEAVERMVDGIHERPGWASSVERMVDGVQPLEL